MKIADTSFKKSFLHSEKVFISIEFAFTQRNVVLFKENVDTLYDTIRRYI